MTTPNLQGISRTLLVPLACRALESPRADAIIHDPRAVELFQALGGSRDFLMGMSGHDLFADVMRVRQFDLYARAFLERHPAGLVVDIGCGLDTRFDRLDNGQMAWLGLDLPEVIALHREFLPDGERERTLAGSMFDLAWLDEVARVNRPAIFLAEGVFTYFSEDQVRSNICALAERFPGRELVFDTLSSFSVRMHNRTSAVLKEIKARLNWAVDDPRSLEAKGLTLLDQWGYFDQHEPRLGFSNLFRFIPAIAGANHVLHYRLGNIGH